MARDDDATPARTPSSMRVSQWGMAQAWLAQKGDKRVFTVTCNARGELVVSAVDQDEGEVSEVVGPMDDPSRAAVAALSKLRSR